LLQAAKQSSDFRDTTRYRTVPVASAWQGIEKVAAEKGYEFRIPKNHPCNPKNQPTAEEAAILQKFESGDAGIF
jgi:hypothetical protein